MLSENLYVESAGRSPWLALYVKSRHEKAVAAALFGKGYEHLLPLYRRIYTGGKTAQLPLFPGYVFCRANRRELLPLMEIPGVFSIVSCGHEPLYVPEEDIARVRTVISSGAPTEPCSYFTAGQTVAVVSGPLQGLSGTLREVGRNSWLVVTVELLKRSVAVKIDRECIAVEPSERMVAMAGA